MYKNEVLLVGFLCRQPEIHYIDKGVAIAKLTLCTKEKGFSYSQGEKSIEFTLYHTIILTNQLAIEYELLLHKDDWVKIKGRLAYRNINDHNNNPKLITEIVAENIELIDKKK